MDKFQAMTAFVRIVEKGSLTAAAVALDTSLPSMVRTLAALERHLGIRLLNRTTRRIHLTDEGAQYLERCRIILSEVQETEAELASRRIELQGRLNSDDALFFLLGSDAFLSLRHWSRAADLLLFCEFIVASRPGFPMEKIFPALPAGIQAGGWRTEAEYFCADLAGPAGQRSTLYFLPGLKQEVSATEIRAALAAGSAPQTVLAPQVAAYIRAHALYGIH